MAERSVALTTVKGGINRLRTKGAALQDSLYDLMNGYVSKARTVKVRPGTFREADLTSDTAGGADTRGLVGFEGSLHVFAHRDLDVPTGYVLHVLRHPADPQDEEGTPLKLIHSATPFMGQLYVVAEFEDNGSSLGSIFHYWVPEGPAWAVEQIYKIGDIVTPPGSALSFRASRLIESSPVWSANAERLVGDIVEPTVYNGFQYTAISVTGDPAKSGTTEPTWPEEDGARVTETEGGDDQVSAAAAVDDAAQLPETVVERYGATRTRVVTIADVADTAAVQPAAVPSADAWEPGKLYPPGAIVRAASLPPLVSEEIANSGFETGDLTSWTNSDGNFVAMTVRPFGGSYCARYSGINTAATAAYVERSTYASVNPGQPITARCYVDQGELGSSPSEAGGWVALAWYDASNVLISVDEGNRVTTGHGGDWQLSTVTAVAPANAAKVKIRGYAYKTLPAATTGRPGLDYFAWNHVYQAPIGSLLFRATQTNAGYSGSSEPSWPSAVAGTVVDNEVTWTAVGTSQIVWEASPIMQSGAYEPTWPTTVGGTVRDGTIAWIATDGRVEDENCPNTEFVTFGASKVFCGDSDIIAYSATANPLDWTSEQDAGYLPFGLQQYGGTPITALGLYRTNLMAFNGQGYQMWQIDEDPTNMALLDASPVDCPYHRTLVPIANDLGVLSSQGIRNIGIAGASTNLQAGYFGTQIDDLVSDAIASLGDGTYPTIDSNIWPLGLYWPGAGQGWWIFGAEAFVLTINGGKNEMSWSRYVFPDEITDWTILGTELYLRTATHLVWRLSKDAIYDDEASSTGAGGDNIGFYGRVWWPYLDFGALGVDKQLEGFDLACDGAVRVSFGYLQSNMVLATPEYQISGDTLNGGMIPMPMTAPSFQMRLTFPPGQAWEWQASALYLTDTP